MTSNENQIVHDLIESFVSSNFMFTAYDVTKAARKQGLVVKHDDVRDAVRRFDFPSTYTKTRADILKLVFGKTGHNTRANVYHPTVSKVEDYVGVDLSGSAPVSTPSVKVVPTTRSATPTNVGDNQLKQVQLDKRGRFWVTSKTLSAIGVRPRYAVYLSLKGSIVISLDEDVIGKDNIDLQIISDNSNNIFISNKHLVTAFGYVPKEVLVTVTDSNTVTVSKVS